MSRNIWTNGVKMMDSQRNSKPVHLVCPKCHYEFEYDVSYYDRKIADLGAEITTIMKQLAIFKSEYHPDFKTNKWRIQATRALAIKQKEVSELRSFRKIANQIANNQELKIFVGLVKEAIPEKQYLDLWQQAEDTMKYNTYDTAIQRYSNISDSVRADE